MPASPKSRVKSLGIIAGGGVLPRILLESCDKRGITPFLVGFKGQTDPAVLEKRDHLLSRPGKAGSIIKELQKQEIRDLVLIGALRRPGIKELLPDARTAAFFAKAGLKAMGDSSLLSAIRRELEDEGFILHGIQDFAPELLMKKGPLGKSKPKKEDQAGIKRGVEISQTIGRLDIGQAVIIQQGHVLGVEGAEGTNALIERCAPLMRKGRGGILVKTCKPQQDRALDLPTIGPETIEKAGRAGLVGIAVQAGHTLVPEKEKLVHLADKYKIFVTGIAVD